MPKEIISTEQEYEKEVLDWIIENGFRKMPMKAFLNGYQLYCQGKDVYQDFAIVLLEFLKDAEVAMMTPDDAFQVIDIQESLAQEEEKHCNKR